MSFVMWLFVFGWVVLDKSEYLPIKHSQSTITCLQQPATCFHAITPIHYVKPIFLDAHIKKEKWLSRFISKLNLKQRLIVYVWPYVLATVCNCQAVLFTYIPLHLCLLESVYVEWTLRSGSRFITSQGIGNYCSHHLERSFWTRAVSAL
jgi:hypothetical protein